MDPQELAELQKRKIAVGTPMYGGKCHGTYAMACNELSAAGKDIGMGVDFHYVYNSSLLPAARNGIVKNFLETDFTHLIFIDSDIRFKALDVLTLALFDEDVILAPVPLTKPDGIKTYNFSLEEGESLAMDRLLNVSHGGTGFMMIKREVFEKYRNSYPDLICFPGGLDKPPSFRYFDFGIRKSDGNYLGEDVFFVENCINIGIKIKLCPWLKIGHSKQKVWEGDLSKLK